MKPGELTGAQLRALDQLWALGREVAAFIETLPRDVDPRWRAIGQTELQQGFMALRRAIEKPEGFA
jgi:hypothetical protein